MSSKILDFPSEQARRADLEAFREAVGRGLMVLLRDCMQGRDRIYGFDSIAYRNLDAVCRWIHSVLRAYRMLLDTPHEDRRALATDFLKRLSTMGWDPGFREPKDAREKIRRFVLAAVDLSADQLAVQAEKLAGDHRPRGDEDRTGDLLAFPARDSEKDPDPE